MIHRWKEESALFTTVYHRVSESSCETAANRSNDCSLVAVMPADASAPAVKRSTALLGLVVASYCLVVVTWMKYKEHAMGAVKLKSV